jgi:hypothetical protein
VSISQKEGKMKGSKGQGGTETPITSVKKCTVIRRLRNVRQLKPMAIVPAKKRIMSLDEYFFEGLKVLNMYFSGMH